MKQLTSKEAYEMLIESEKLNPGRWIQHSKKVGESAAKIAQNLGLDTEKIKAMGFIHDIGKRFGESVHHVIKGYEYINKLGYDEEYANICITHSYLNNDINCTAGGIPNPTYEDYEFRKKFVENHTYTIYDKIINLCDLICTDKIVILEQRLIDIMIRRGVHENTQYHILKSIELKREIEYKLGCNIYSLFPEVTKELLNG